jgi:hypothetical protein
MRRIVFLISLLCSANANAASYITGTLNVITPSGNAIGTVSDTSQSYPIIFYHDGPASIVNGVAVTPTEVGAGTVIAGTCNTTTGTGYFNCPLPGGLLTAPHLIYAYVSTNTYLAPLGGSPIASTRLRLAATLPSTLATGNNETYGGVICDDGSYTFTQAKVYVGATVADGGTLVGTYPTTQTTNATVCGAKIARSFSVPITPTMRNQRIGNRLYAYGIDSGSGTPFLAYTDDVAHVYPMVVFRPETYGAVADGVTDSTAGINSAIAAAQATGQWAEVLLSAGTYLICPGGAGAAGWQCLAQINSDKTIIGGVGPTSKLLIGGLPLGAIDVENASNAKLIGFSMDWQTPPFAQGKVTNVSYSGSVGAYNTTITVLPDVGSTAMSDSNFTSSPSIFGMIFAQTIPRLKADTQNAFATTVNPTPDGGGHYLINEASGNLGPLVAIGDRWVQLARNDSPAIGVSTSSMVTIDGVTIFASPNLATWWWQNYGLLIVNDLNVRRSPLALNTYDVAQIPIYRDLSTNADGIHMQTNWNCANACLNKYGPAITNSFMEGMGDDFINMYSRGEAVVSISGKSLVVATGSNIKAGDTIQIYNPTTGLLIGQSKVTASTGDSGGNYTLTLKDTLGGVSAGYIVFDLTSAGPAAVISNNVFAYARSGRVYVKSSGAVISGNFFADLSDSAVELDAILDSAGGSEGPDPTNVTVQNNVFVGGDNFGGAPQGQIFADTRTESGGWGTTQVTGNINIIGNTFTTRGFPPIYLRSVKNVSITTTGGTVITGGDITCINSPNVRISGALISCP